MALDIFQTALGEAWGWVPVVAIAATFGWRGVRSLIYVWGLAIAVRGTSGPDRAAVLAAYAACIAAQSGALNPRIRGSGSWQRTQ